VYSVGVLKASTNQQEAEKIQGIKYNDGVGDWNLGISG
jgi:hypothetical protein